MSIELILSIAGILIAAGGIYYTYTVSGRVDRQNIIINDNIITKSKQANFTAGIESYQKMNPNGKVHTVYELIIVNNGEQPARNFSVETSNGGQYLMLPDNMFPIDLFHPGQKLSFQLLVYSGIPDLLYLKFRWSDDYEGNRELPYTVKTT